MHLESLENRTLFATGLQATYFDDMNFGAGTVSTARVDRAIDFNWAAAKPAPGIRADTYSVRWTGRMKAISSESYRLMVLTESPVRVWIGDKLVVDGWASTSKPVTYKGTIDLVANRRYDVQIDYAHNTGNASAKFMWQTDTLTKQTVPSKYLTPQDATLNNKLNHAVMFARDQISRTLKDFPTPSTAGYPEQTDSKGKWIVKPASGWTAGYFGGTMWQLNKYFGGGWSARATKWTTPIAPDANQPGDHFSRVWNTFKPLYDSTGDAQYAQVLITAANAKDAQFSTKIGAFRTPPIASNSGNPNANFGVLMDQTLDMDLMFWASEYTGDARYRDHAKTHVQTVISKMIRADGSVFQRYFFDGATGAAIGGENYQGYSNSSTWSRGQAWAIYAFSRLAQLDGQYLDEAKKLADYWVANVPSDGVPYWDFALPSTAPKYRDTSAAAIAAVGLHRLRELTGDVKYLNAGTNTLSNLAGGKYLAEGTVHRGVLQHAALNVAKNIGNDVSLIFADFYFLEAINAYTNKG